jgi:hypothetical protein
MPPDFASAFGGACLGALITLVIVALARLGEQRKDLRR